MTKIFTEGIVLHSETDDITDEITGKIKCPFCNLLMYIPTFILGKKVKPECSCGYKWKFEVKVIAIGEQDRKR